MVYGKKEAPMTPPQHSGMIDHSRFPGQTSDHRTRWIAVLSVVSLGFLIWALVATFSGGGTTIKYVDRSTDQTLAIAPVGSAVTWSQQTDADGNNYATATCASGYTSVDLPLGTTINVQTASRFPLAASYFKSITIAAQSDENGNQSEVDITAHLASNTAVGAMIVHAAPGVEDTTEVGAIADHALNVRVGLGGMVTYKLVTASYVGDQFLGDAISNITFCVYSAPLQS
jgi:hypothetical protein